MIADVAVYVIVRLIPKKEFKIYFFKILYTKGKYQWNNFCFGTIYFS